ncbi:MAG: hypothetical protein Q4G03_00320 [Planctomycetia bacterium]|nr:hypothetical protein [Planctomycetia bacterium]
MIRASVNVKYLFDASGGHYKVARRYQAPQVEYCGCADGLTPENLAEQFVEIATVVGDRRFYLDMESGVRDRSDQFDLTRVRNVLEYVAKRIRTV